MDSKDLRDRYKCVSGWNSVTCDWEASIQVCLDARESMSEWYCE